MFEFAESNKVWWPVTINVPADGGPKQVKVEVLYSLLTKSAAQKIVQLSREKQAEAMLEHVNDWKNFFDVHGNEITFTGENLLAVMDFTFIDEAITCGWREASRGAATKN